jgi:pimeloyl-ACP methyl ester carboxylesterase
VASANDAGMATLALDRIGTGRSSQPLGLAVTIDSNAFVAHQVVQALRHGPLGEYQRVALVAHSYGSWTAWYESSRYRDVDVAVFSGISHGITPTAYARLLPRFFPAPLDAQLRGRVHDLTYLTSQPGERYTMFHAPGPVDPSLLAYDEAHKTTVTAGEIDNFPLILTQPLDIRAPVLLANSTLDPLFCGLLAADCSTAERLVATEGPYLGPDVPSIGGFVLPGAGHDLNYAPNAPSWFETAQRWIARHTG